ncbi:MAG: DNA recombination protein RmuC, partial [Planctomycetota bacterium]
MTTSEQVLVVAVLVVPALVWAWQRALARAHTAADAERSATERAEAAAVLAAERARVEAAQQQIHEQHERLAELETERTAHLAVIAEREAAIADLRVQLEGERARNDGERALAEDRITTLTQAEQRLREQFQAVAAETLEKTAGSLGARHNERLESLLKPLGERIQRFEQQVAETFRAETKDRSALRGELSKLFDLNQQMSVEASNLTRALKGDS